MGVDVVVFVVHGQSSSLSDCMDPYIHGLISHGHRPEVLVIDSSEDPADRNMSKESLLKIHREHRLVVSFSSRREQERYLSKLDDGPLRYALGGDSIGTGALLNMGILSTMGRSALFVDADTRFEVSGCRVVAEGDLYPPIIRKFNLALNMASRSKSVARMGLWGVSSSASGGCFYRNKECVIPPFIPSESWDQGVPWFLMSRYSPPCAPVSLPWAVRKLSAVKGLPMAYVPLMNMIYDVVGEGSLSGAAGDLAEYLSDSDQVYSDGLLKYIELLVSWDETMGHVDYLCEQGVKIGYKP